MRKAGEGIAIAVIGAFAIWGAAQVPAPPEGETWAGVLPMGAAILLSMAGVWMIIEAVRDGDVAVGKFGKTSWSVLALFIVALAYQQAIVLFGYELPTAVAAPIVLWIFGIRSPVGLALSVVLCPLAFHLVFFRLLGAFPPYAEVFDLMYWLGV